MSSTTTVTRPNYGYEQYYDDPYVIEDVNAILAGKRYAPRGTDEMMRIPEDVSTYYVLEKHGIDAYDGRREEEPEFAPVPPRKI